MFKKIICVLMCVVLLSLCACSKDTGVDKSFVFPIDESPTYLDPQIVSGVSGRLIVSNCFEGLVRLDENGNVAPGAASNWTVSKDGCTYTFNLRADSKWYLTKSVQKTIGEDALKTFDTSVTSDDFLFAFRRAVSPETGSGYAMSLSSIKNAEAIINGSAKVESLGVSAPDKYTFVITLTAADDDFLLALTTPISMPCNRAFFDMTGGRYGVSSAYLIYNGPFYISSWTAGGSATIKKNEEFKSVYTVSPASVYFSLNDNQETRLSKLREDTYDLAPMTDAQIEQIEQEEGITPYAFENGIKALMFNCSDELMSNIKLRRALVISFGEDMPARKNSRSIVPGSCVAGGKNYREAAGSVKLPPYNTESALKLFNEALSELDTDTVSFTVMCTATDETAVRSAMQTWQALFGIAIDVKCECVEAEDMQKRLERGDYSIALSEIMSNSDFACDFISRFMSTSENNNVFFKNNAYDEIISRARRADTASALVGAISEAEQYLVDKSVIIPIEGIINRYASAEGVNGIVFSASGELVHFAYAKKVD